FFGGRIMPKNHEVPDARRNLAEVVGRNATQGLRRGRIVVETGSKSAINQEQLELALAGITKRVVLCNYQTRLDNVELYPEGHGEVAIGKPQVWVVRRRKALAQT